MKNYIPAFLLASILTTSLTTMAATLELNPYVSAKYAYTHMQNDAKVTVDVSSIANNTLVDKKLSDNTNGLRLAVGTTVPADGIRGDIRGEVEFAYNAYTDNKGNAAFNWGNGRLINSVYNSKLQTKAAFFNVYYDIETCTDFIPYVGGGIGYAHLKHKTHFVDYKGTGKDIGNNFAWNVGFGLGYNITENITLDLGYRYTDYGSIKYIVIGNRSNTTITSASKYDITSHEVSLGLRYNF